MHVLAAHGQDFAASLQVNLRGLVVMGLSICRTLVTSHGGRLWAERRAERGAAFYVALPLAKGEESKA